MSSVDYTVVEAGPEWADKFRLFSRLAHIAYYIRPELGVTSDLYSEAAFATDGVIGSYKKLFANGAANKVWLALDVDRNILGGVGAHKYPSYLEIKRFYVKPGHQGQGIGHALFERVKQFADSLPMQLDVVNYMRDSIDLYKHWGFVVDESKGQILYPWEEWPEEIRRATYGVYMTRAGGK